MMRNDVLRDLTSARGPWRDIRHTLSSLICTLAERHNPRVGLHCRMGRARGYHGGREGAHMLEGIRFIKSLGLFADFAQVPGTDFAELTLIFGENGVGKTTIAAILDSLRERDALAIIRRRSLPGGAAPSCAVGLDGTVFSFDGAGWDGQPPYGTMEVFFPDFVARNVYVGGGVGTENKRNLCEFVLGRLAVADVEKLTVADAEARSALADVKQTDAQLALVIKAPDTVETFLALLEDPEIEEHLADARAGLAAAMAAEQVLARPLPVRVETAAPSRKQLTALLAETDTNIAPDAAKVVRGHVDSVLGEGGEEWLDFGTKHIVDEHCPYCGQDVGDAALVKALRAYFSAEYRDLVAHIAQGIETTRAGSSLAALGTIKAEIRGQLAIAAQWEAQCALDPKVVEAHLTAAEESWAQATVLLDGVLRAKQSSPLDVIAPGAVEQACVFFDEALDHLSSMNDSLSECATVAADYKKTLAAADKEGLTAAVSHLDNQRLRYTKPVLDLVAKRGTDATRRSVAETEKVRLKGLIDTHAAAVVGKYEAGINWYLEFFGCDIRIAHVEPKYAGGKASVSYELTVRGHRVALASVADEPCFDSVLSEGDKCSLALAFFLARLKDIADLSAMVIVMDDPVNSFGGSRRRLVAGVIRDLRKRGAQVVVLTHDERLAAMMWRDSTRIGAMKKIVPLQIERTAAGSRLVPWDAERAMRSEYVEDYLTMVAFLEGAVGHEVAAACIRPYVEQRLRHLFPGPPLEIRDTLGQMITKIRNSGSGDRLYVLKPKLAELEAIEDGGLPAAHATDDVPAMPPLGREEVRVFVQKALDILP